MTTTKVNGRPAVVLYLEDVKKLTQLAEPEEIAKGLREMMVYLFLHSNTIDLQELDAERLAMYQATELCKELQRYLEPLLPPATASGNFNYLTTKI